MGITNAFENNADFSGMSDDVRTKVSKVKRQTFLLQFAIKSSSYEYANCTSSSSGITASRRCFYIFPWPALCLKLSLTLTASFVLHRRPTRLRWVSLRWEQRRQLPPLMSSYRPVCHRQSELTGPSWPSSWRTPPGASSSWARSTTPQPCRESLSRIIRRIQITDSLLWWCSRKCAWTEFLLVPEWK